MIGFMCMCSRYVKKDFVLGFVHLDTEIVNNCMFEVVSVIEVGCDGRACMSAEELCTMCMCAIVSPPFTCRIYVPQEHRILISSLCVEV
jgi:hypothetical protein